MRLLHVITSLQSGGAEKLMVDLLPRFNAAGAEASLAVFNAVDTPFMRRLEEAGVSVHRFYPEGCNVYSPLNLRKLRRLTGDGGYDIVHTHNTAPQIFGSLCGARRHTAYITTEHNTTNRRRGNQLLRYVDRWMYSRYRCVICISQGTADALGDYLGPGVSDKCVVVNNGIDLDSFRCQVRDIAGEKVKIVVVAGFRQQKDQDTVIRALARLPERFALTLVGDGERRRELEELCTGLGLQERITFAGVCDNVPQIISDHDIVVVSSHWEGFGLSAVEGMAAGRPVVASDVEGLAEVVGGAGILFPLGDDMALADILGRLADDSLYYHKTASACQERSGRYSIDVTARKYMDLYRQHLS